MELLGIVLARQRPQPRADAAAHHETDDPLCHRLAAFVRRREQVARRIVPHQSLIFQHHLFRELCNGWSADRRGEGSAAAPDRAPPEHVVEG